MSDATWWDPKRRAARMLSGGLDPDCVWPVAPLGWTSTPAAEQKEGLLRLSLSDHVQRGDTPVLAPLRARQGRLYGQRRGDLAAVGLALAMALCSATGRPGDGRWLHTAARKVAANPSQQPTLAWALALSREVGLPPIKFNRIGHLGPPNPRLGAQDWGWVRSAWEVRACLARGARVILGFPWYTTFNRPWRLRAAFSAANTPAAIGHQGRDWGRQVGGACCWIRGYDDRFDAVCLAPPWLEGVGEPLLYLPMSSLSILLGRGAEAVVITAWVEDR
jgi:hypothetical protein